MLPTVGVHQILLFFTWVHGLGISVSIALCRVLHELCNGARRVIHLNRGSEVCLGTGLL